MKINSFQTCRILISLFILTRSLPLIAQHYLSSSQLSGQTAGSTSVLPFLLIAPDARSAAMGDAGVASTPDASSTYWNPAKLAFIDTTFGLNASFVPWLRALVPDINLFSFSGYYKLTDTKSIGASVRYFSLGDVTISNPGGSYPLSYHPNEYACDLSYAQKLFKHFSAGITGRYIYSNATNQGQIWNGSIHSVETVTLDLSAFYHTDQILLAGKQTVLNVGIHLSDIGSKIAYVDSTRKDYPPTNLRIGGCLILELNKQHSLSILGDLNRMRVPNQPGTRFCGGLEYWYAKLFAVRMGYVYQTFSDTAVDYYTLGFGLKYKNVAFDFADWLPPDERSPIQNTLRLTASCNF